MERLWEWADRVGIPSGTLPRNKSALMRMDELIINEDIGDPECVALRELPDEIGELKHLSCLYIGLEATGRLQLPESLCKLTELTDFGILNYGTGFVVLPTCLSQLKHLERLTFSGEIDRNSIAPLLQGKGLKKLEISYNSHMQTLPLYPQAATSIRELKLINNENLMLTPSQVDWGVSLRDDEKGYEMYYVVSTPDGEVIRYQSDFGQKFQYYCITPSRPPITGGSPLAPPNFPDEEELEQIERRWLEGRSCL
jgi:hypothetical protein